MPDLPGDPVKLFLNLSGPMATCGDVTLAMLPAEVDPAVAVSLITISLILILHVFIAKSHDEIFHKHPICNEKSLGAR